ncbi:MAG: heavy metal-binding domain-containing protein [Alphaproteobacteria bacterium]|nr:heavy metal-binding domain-containing protein [Alphaproteobacteria bacterium]
MKLTVQDQFAELAITETLGIVRGNVVRSRFFGRDIMAALRMLAGGEVQEYTKLMAESREQALDRMVEQATLLRADGIVAVRFTTSLVAQGAAEMMAYGTAVKLRALS